MNLKLYYFSFYVLIYDWIRLDVVKAEKVIGLDAVTPLDDEDADLRLVQKRFIQRAIDPLMRRSPLDKNFMRFGKRSDEKQRRFDEKTRRSPVEEDHDLDEIINITPESEFKLVSDDTGDSKSKRVKQDFIRFGRGKQDFIRFGRGKQDFIRFGRGKQDFIRFGRGKQDFIRFGRGDLGTVYRKPDSGTNFDLEVIDDDFKTGDDDMERSPRAKNSFMRFGRAENFIRFGRNVEVGAPADNINYRTKRSDDEIRYVRNGDSVPAALFVADVNPVEIRRSSGFIRLGRGDPRETGNKLDLEAGAERRKKRSVEESLETTTTIAPPKIGFKGIVVVPPETETGAEDRIGNETDESNTSEKNELSQEDYPITEPPEKNFHIPSIRHKRRAYDLVKKFPKEEDALWETIKFQKTAPQREGLALGSPDPFSHLLKLRQETSKDYLVRIG